MDNRTGILLFGLGGGETFGINVFKVKSIIQIPEITKTPGNKPGVLGMISLRGDILPVFDLSELMELPSTAGHELLLITEFRRHTQAFAVNSVDRIIHIDAKDLKPVQDVFKNGAGFGITSVVRRDDDSLVSIIDVEQIYSKTVGEVGIPDVSEFESHDTNERSVFFVDDSPFAVKEISRTLEKCKTGYQYAKDGKEAYERLISLSMSAAANGKRLSDDIFLILTDAEMPEMDGYELTRKIRETEALADIPVVMHSSLSSIVNAGLSKSSGACDYIEKFDPVSLAETFAKYRDREKQK